MTWKNNDDVKTLYYWILVERMKLRVKGNDVYAKWYTDGRIYHNSNIVQEYPILRPLLLNGVVER